MLVHESNAGRGMGGGRREGGWRREGWRWGDQQRRTAALVSIIPFWSVLYLLFYEQCFYPVFDAWAPSMKRVSHRAYLPVGGNTGDGICMGL